MTNVLVDDSYLSDIADTIRSKLGVQDTYKPSAMADAIDEIGGGSTPTGTLNISANGTYDVTNYASADVAVPGASGTKQISITQNGTTTEDVTNYASAEITVNVSGGGGNPNENLVKLIEGTLTRIECSATSVNAGLRNNAYITSVYLPACTTLTTDCFYNDSYMTTAVLPAVTTIPDSGRCFYGNSRLTAVDFNAPNRIAGSLFSACSAMATLVIRSSTVVPLENINAFANSPFASGKAGGTLYVPQALISSYQSANNWSTILGYATNNIQAIEGSTYATQYVDGTLI